MLLDPQGGVHLAFQLTVTWANPPEGMIPLPSEADPPIPYTHAVAFIGRIPDRRLFHFRVKWSDWGDHGTGYMPYEYFDRYVFECWAPYRRPEVLRLFKSKTLDDEGRLRWSAHDEDDHHIHAFEVRDARGDERRAWAFVVERDGALEVEELYVRPEYRRLGHGRWLADRVAQLARERRIPLRLWVGFADCKAESESNYLALVATARRLGVQFRPCPVPWAAYYGTTEQPGEVLPVEPETIPDRPRAPRDTVRAFVMALGLGVGEPGVNGIPPVPAHQAQEAEIAVGTPEWDELTERRAALIDKMYSPGQGLTDEEQAEYERLQQRSRAAIDRAYPRPKLAPDELAVIKQALGIKDDVSGQ
jgi:GNAT superfamily N-acetyltransferase